MATMVKEKRREKKKVKEKSSSKIATEQEQPPILNESKRSENIASTSEIMESVSSIHAESFEETSKSSNETTSINSETLDHKPGASCVTDNTTLIPTNKNVNTERETLKNDQTTKETENSVNAVKNLAQLKLTEKEIAQNQSIGNTYQNLNSRLERISIPSLNQNLSIGDIQNRLENPQAYLNLDKEATDVVESNEVVQIEETQQEVEHAIPSAPVFEEPEAIQYFQQPEDVTIEKAKSKLQCMPLEEAVKLYGGTEMERVRAISEKEETIVEAGPVTGPEHPLVDLLSTFRSSLIAVDRERIQLSKGYTDEEKFRNTLWKIEKKNVTVSEDCPCGSVVTIYATYEHAELLKERLPVAKLKLEGLLKDVQESYCHHQHTALLTHCQIEELISETIKSNKKEIREALALILQALRLSDNAPTALGVALQRWAAALSAAMLDGRDISHLLHLIHHLFRQTRSVRWAARVVRSYIRAGDRAEAAQALATLDLLLARPRLEPALECTEDADESWEEMDKCGGSGAVSDGSLRERDLLALLRSFPAQELVARIVLFTRHDVSQVRPYEWGDRAGGSGVLKACCGVRALLATLQRGVTSHPTYTRLHALLKAIAVNALHALGGLHLHSREYYSKELEDKIAAELEACFCAGFELLGAQQLQRVPATLLSDHTAGEYCCVNILALHDKSPRPLDFLAVCLPVCECGARAELVCGAALDRLYDHQLARTVLEFLFQTGIKRKSSPCAGTCEATARAHLPRLLDAHAYLHTLAFHMLAEYSQVDPLDPSSIDPLSPHAWRPSAGELKQVLEDWSTRCSHLIQHLLLKLDYRPHSGLHLDAQLTVGSWLCEWLKQAGSLGAAPEWAWSVLRRLRTHRTWWGVAPEAPPPDPPPDDLFSMAYAVLSSSWGHCIPLICSEGISALCKLSALRAVDAAHCLGPVMLLMAHSPESVTFTPKFTELFSSLLKAGPTIVQRALGWGPEPGADVLLRLILTQIEGNFPGIPRSSLVSAWLHALWKPSLPSSAQLETILLASREWLLFDAHATHMLQDKTSSEFISAAVRNVSTAPLLCACVLRNAHAAGEARGWGALLDGLRAQRARGDKTHVDNALKRLGASMRSEDLVIYRCAGAVLCAPAQRPAHLTLWALFLHLYLQRPPSSMSDTTPPVGPQFFSGLIKSRVLAQLRKKLQETITYHHNETENLKQSNREETPQAPSRSKTVKRNSTEDGVVPMLDIRDLSGVSSDSDSESESSEEVTEDQREDVVDKKDLELLMKYHAAAESMCKEYLRWLDEGDNTRALPHHADIARFVPEQVLDAAWVRELRARRPPPAVEETPPPTTPTTPPASPFQSAVARILCIKDYSTRRSRKLSIKSSLEDLDLRDERSLLSLVEKLLADMETLAEEWCDEARRVTSLDGALWALVGSLRVRRPLPPVRKQCAQRCKPLTIHIPHQEWCISSGAERGIEENRRAARALVRRLARPRPHAASSAAALTTIARHINSAWAAKRMTESVWRCARVAHGCAPAHSALATLLDLLADRWLSHDGPTCSELLGRWGNNSSSPLQQSLCGALVCPRRLPAPQWPRVYCTVLTSRLPPHIVFSYLSKFEMSRWAEVAEPSQRRELLEALVSTAQRWGIDPDSECHVLLELLGVHTATLLNPPELCMHIVRCAHAAVRCTLPPHYWTHVTRATVLYAEGVPFDELGHVLRSQGELWWAARSDQRSASPKLALYGAPTALLLRALARAFVSAGKRLSYAPERVSLYVWSALQESWSPWVVPHHTPPLLADEQHATMLNQLVETIHQLMLDCPGIEEDLLQRVFSWVVETSLSAACAPAQARVQLSALLEATRALPWHHQWFRPACLQHALQVCASNNKDIQSWCSAAWRAIAAQCWVRDAPDTQLAPLLASLLCLFTNMTHHEQTLEQATRLPWWRLPEAALEEALERFFMQHHNPSVAYHALPQFRVVLFASELCIHPSSPPPALLTRTARNKRAIAVSRWTLSASAPALSDQAPAHTERLLRTLTDTAPYLEASPDELEELLGRAAAIMCIEPAATAALPVWCAWVSSTSARMVCACVSAAGALTAFDYFAALADAAIRAHCNNKECGGWSDVCARLQPSPWRSAGPLVGRGRLFAAYAVSRAHAHTPPDMQTALLALVAANINFIENEHIIAVWICVACRYAARPPAAGARAECGAAARALLTRTASEQRRTLRTIVTMQADTTQPTPQHRLLSRLALCLVSPSDAAVKAYSASCAALLGASPDAPAWGRAPRAGHVPRLAVRLYPHAEKYFQHELDLVPDD